MHDTTTDRASIFRNAAAPLLAAAVVLLGLLLAWRHDFVLFHVLAEFFSIAVAAGIFMLVWNARRFLGQGYLLFVGMAYAFVGGIDLLHMLSYRGMDIIQGYDVPNLPTQLWIAGRYLQAVSLVIAPVFLNRRLKFLTMTVAGFALITAGLMGLIFQPAIWPFTVLGFPVCYADGALTSFKITSEYVICGLLLLAMLLLLLKGKRLDRKIRLLIAASIGVTVLSELAFTQYAGVYDYSNGAGHILKIAAFYLMYLALIETGITKPYSIFLRDLKRSEQALRQSEAQFRSVMMSSPLGMILYEITSSGELVIAEANPAAGTILGIDAGELIGKTLEQAFPDVGNSDLPAQFRRVATIGAPWSRREHPYGDGTVNGVFQISCFRIAPGRIAVKFDDVTQRRRAREQLKLSYSFLEIANRHTEMTPLLDEFVAETKRFTACQAVAIRVLNEDNTIPYQAHDGFSDEFCRAEGALCVGRDPCMCARVITGQAPSDSPAFTEGGSFWVPSTSRYVASLDETELPFHRNRCHKEGYESVALVPIRSRGRILGLIHVADARTDALSRETVQTLEHAAMQLGTAILRVQAEETIRRLNAELEKRVAERTSDLAETVSELEDQVRERVAAEEALRESEAFARDSLAELDRIYNTVPLGMCLLDRQLRFTRVNNRLAAMTGRPAAAHLGASLEELAPHVAERLAPICRCVLEGLDADGELEIAGIDLADEGNRPRWLAGVFPLTTFDGKSQGVGVVLQDVTEQRRLEGEVLRASEMERQRIGQDLHDSLGQLLGGLVCLSQVLTGKLAKTAPSLVAEGERITKLLTSSLNLTRSLAHGLRPVGLNPDGLTVAMQELAGNVESMFKVSCRFECEQDVQVSDGMVATHLYHIVQEAASNAVRHGKAQNLQIRMEQRDEALSLHVRDDGRGFDPANGNGHGMGLRIMQYRARTIGASFHIGRNRDGGMTVTCRLQQPRKKASV